MKGARAIAIALAAAAGALSASGARTNVSGVVTFEREGIPFYFVRDSNGVNWRVAKPHSAPVARPGDAIEAWGEREPSAKHRLQTARFAITGVSPDGVPQPKSVTIRELFANIMPFGNTMWYGGLFKAEGILRDVNRRQNVTQILVGEGDANLIVELPVKLDEPLPADLRTGAMVEVAGALAYTSLENWEDGSFGRIENVELIPRSMQDVRVVKRAPAPPFWTARRAGGVLAGAAALVAVLFVWVATLRRMVRRKTGELAESIRQRETARIEADASRRERLRLAADLHDGFQQYLAGAMFRLRAALNYLPADAAKSREQLENVRDALQHTQNGLRQTIWAMNEESEGPESITALLRFVARRMAHWEGVVEIDSDGEERPVVRNFCGSLLLIVQEAVGNAIKHGAAKKVSVRISFREKDIILSVSDDGGGFDPAARKDGGHYGLATMRRRIAALGGSMTVDSAPGEGCRLVFTVPA